jgi:hypothetical protein
MWLGVLLGWRLLLLQSNVLVKSSETLEVAFLLLLYSTEEVCEACLR